MAFTPSLKLLDWCCLAFGGLLLAFLLNKRMFKQKLANPPGPPGYPIVGNVFNMPLEKEWETYLEWSRQYDSDVVSVNLLGQRLIILNTLEAVADLLDKRSLIYSGRPQTVMIRDLMGIDWSVAFMNYGAFWRNCRKIIHQGFHPDATARYYPQELAATQKFLNKILDEPARLMDHLRQMAGEVIMSVTYGINVQSHNDPYIAMAELAVEAVTVGSIPGAFLVDVIPPLKYVPNWFPGAGFQKVALHYREALWRTLNLPFVEAKRLMDEHGQQSSFVSYCLSKLDKSKDIREQERAIMCAAATMHGAGSDTTVSTIASAVLGLISNQDALRRAQAQIDSVIGKARLPDFSDKENLPWVTAIVREALRWNPVLPIAIPHKLSVDDEYKGYFMPANSIVIGNAWAILHNPDTYPDPFKFKPERFMDGDTLNHQVKDPATVAFGFGRRICPGRYIAESSMWIMVANIIAAFDVSPETDTNGHTIQPSNEYTPGLLSYPKPFQCKIVPRDEQSRRLVMESVDGFK